jgi:hypothetical protein
VASLVESPSTGELNVGKTVTLTLNLSEAVTVAGGTPTLTLNDGGTATYTGGSGTSALTFRYTVAAGENTAALAATAVNLNSATVNSLPNSVTANGGGSLTDANGHVWSFGAASTYGDLILRDGVPTGGQAVTLTLDVNGVIWAENNQSNWYMESGSGWVAELTGPTTLPGQAANLSLAGLTQTGPQINTAAPAAPVFVNDVVKGNHVTLTGTAEADSTVTVYDGHTSLGSTIANSDGSWSYTTHHLATGAHTFVATATDASGNASPFSSPLDPLVGQNVKTSHGDKTNSTVHSNGINNAATLDDIFGTSPKSDSALSSKDHQHTSTTAPASHQSSIVSVSADPSGSADHGSVLTSASGITPMATTDTSPQWQIDISKLRDMIASLENGHKNILSSAALSSDLSAAGLINSGPDGFVFKSDLGEEISKQLHSASDSLDGAHQLNAIYAELSAEFQSLGAQSDSTTSNHDVLGSHVHGHDLHIG